MKLATQTATATVAQPKHQLNVNTLAELAAKTLELNAIGVAEITTDRGIVFEPYREAAVHGVFLRYLGRPASPAELLAFTPTLSVEAPDVRPVIEAVVSSGEYFGE